MAGYKNQLIEHSQNKIIAHIENEVEPGVLQSIIE